MADKIAHGTAAKKLTPQDVSEIERFAESIKVETKLWYLTKKQRKMMAKKFGIHLSTINSIVYGYRFKRLIQGACVLIR